MAIRVQLANIAAAPQDDNELERGGAYGYCCKEDDWRQGLG
jgi:hypothetical protein